jgi:hypothetical protein
MKSPYRKRLIPKTALFKPLGKVIRNSPMKIKPKYLAYIIDLPERKISLLFLLVFWSIGISDI